MPQDHDLAFVGSLSLGGPERGQEKRCARGAPCRIAGVEGQGLLAGDQLRIALQCGSAAAELPNGGVAEAVVEDGVATFDLGSQSNASNALLHEAGKETEKLR